MAWDTVVVLAAITGLVILGAVTDPVPGSGRVVVVALAAIVVLYEPLMVARFGATVGHRRMNLRVVDEATGGNPPFARAAARFLIKGLLGLPSFTTMALTRRHQAIHDRLTGTTVRVRDLDAARAEEIRFERELPDPATLPSRARRAAAILVHVGVAFVAMSMASALTVSPPCLDSGRCGDADEMIQRVLGLAWIGASMWCVVAGWRGQLFGARRRAEARTEGTAA